MKITVEFDSEEEFKARIKNPRGAKGGNDDGEGQPGANQAPAPLQPPQGQPQAFNPGPAPQFSPPAGNAFPGAPTTINSDPAVQALVTRINTRLDGLVTSGQPTDAMLNWFRGRFGPEAANATMDQIKTNFLPKQSVPALEETAKLIGA